MVVTNRTDYDHSIRMLRDWGQEKKYRHELKGYNYRMEALQGAVLRVKLRHLEAWNAARRAHAARYDALLAGHGLGLPARMKYARHVYHVYAIRTYERAILQEAFAVEDIQTGIHYPVPVHPQEAYGDVDDPSGAFPCAEAAAREVLSLPLYPEMATKAVEEVAGVLQRVGGRSRDAFMNATEAD